MSGVSVRKGYVENVLAKIQLLTSLKSLTYLGGYMGKAVEAKQKPVCFFPLPLTEQ